MTTRTIRIETITAEALAAELTAASDAPGCRRTHFAADRARQYLNALLDAPEERAEMSTLHRDTYQLLGEIVRELDEAGADALAPELARYHDLRERHVRVGVYL